jgi:toxin ParE1/3/4
MRPYELLSIAEKELNDSVCFFNGRSDGLGERLLADFESIMERLGKYPESGPRVSRKLRIARLSDFPYNVVYHIEPKRILVAAFAHQSRKPRYWKGRL